MSAKRGQPESSQRGIVRLAVAPDAKPTPKAATRPRRQIIDDLQIQLAHLDTTILELGLPADNELADFVNLIRCRLRPLCDDDASPSSSKRDKSPASQPPLTSNQQQSDFSDPADAIGPSIDDIEPNDDDEN